MTPHAHPIAACALSLGAGLTLAGFGATIPSAAQSATPGTEAPLAIEVVLFDKDGAAVGVAVLVETADGLVNIDGGISGMTPGAHGIHVHETGICHPAGDEPFSSAGDHFNPTGVKHGGPPAVAMGTPPATGATPVAASGHAGDLGNIVAGESGLAAFHISTDRYLLPELADADGSALVVHGGEDDLTTDPSGNSGGRVACGVIAAPLASATPVPA